jgi:site-specific DNA-adenine methylase
MRLIAYYGAKNRIASKYPTPIYDTIIEPFAGSAGYSLHHHQKKVILIEKDEKTFGALNYLIKAKPEEIMSLPLLSSDDDLRAINLPDEAKWLIGFWVNNGVATPANKLSKWAIEAGDCSQYWSEKCRRRLASCSEKIKHWKIMHGSFEIAPDMEATWFIDPPYQNAGKYYKCSSKDLDFTFLSNWCRSRRGQAIVCENMGANWLPFKEFCVMDGASKNGTTRRRSIEAIWTNEQG